MRGASKIVKTLLTLVVGFVAATAFCALLVALPPTRRGLFCSEIVNPYDLVTMYVVTIPADGHARYDGEFVHFARAQGLMTNSGQQMLQEVGGDRRFLNYQTTACDGIAYVWSENVAKPNEFVVTFHYNKIFGKHRAEEVRAEFVRQFGGRYRVEREISWDKRVPIGPADSLVGGPDR